MQLAKVSHDDAGVRIERWFQRNHKAVPYSLLSKMLRKGRIKVNGKKAKPGQKVEEGDELYFPELYTSHSSKVGEVYQGGGGIEALNVVKVPKHLEKELVSSILFMDEDIIVINKPAGLAVQGGTKIRYSVDSLSECLKYDYAEKPKLVHRLDKETSGILVLARRTAVAAELAAAFKQRDINKTYIALVYGCPRPHEGVIDIPLEKLTVRGFDKASSSPKGKRAVTRYRVLSNMSDTAALLEIDLVTGRTHQIRAHLSMIDCPIVGDSKYKKKDIVALREDHLFLHAYTLSFVFKGKDLYFKAPLPAYFEAALKFYGLKSS